MIEWVNFESLSLINELKEDTMYRIFAGGINQ